MFKTKIKEKTRSEVLEDAARELHNGNKTLEDYMKFAIAAQSVLKQGSGLCWWQFENAV